MSGLETARDTVAGPVGGSRGIVNRVVERFRYPCLVNVRLPLCGGRFQLLPLLALTWLLVGWSAATAEWEPMGPTAATLFSFAGDPHHPGTLYGGAHFGGLYRSGDSGMHWKPVAGAFSNATVFSIDFDPVRPGRIFLGTFAKGIFHSPDDGLTWGSLNGDLDSLTVSGVIADEQDASRLVAATTTGIRITTDFGRHWRPATSGLDGVAILALARDSAVSSRLYAGTDDGVWYSDDSGERWLPLGDGTRGRTVTSLVPSREVPGDLYAAASDGAFFLASGSGQWQEITRDLPAGQVNQVLPRPMDDGLFAVTEGGIYRLQDLADTTWELWNPFKARMILPHPNNQWLYLVGAYSRLLLTPDDGETFVDVVNGIQNRFVGALETVEIGATTVLYAGSDEGVEFTTEAYSDGERQFWIAGDGYRGTVFDLERVEQLPGTLYMGTERNGVWKSGNFGNSWVRKSSGMVPSRIFDFSAADDVIYAATSSGVFLSRDDGANWEPDDPTATPRVITAVEADPVRPGIGWYGTSDGLLFRTLDGGRHFHQVWSTPDGSYIREIEAAPYFDVYLVTSTGHLYASTDVGVNFFRRATGIQQRILSVAVDHVRPWNLWLGTLFGGLWHSETSAIEWQPVDIGVNDAVVYSVLVDPEDSSTISVGLKGRVLASTDGGGSWQTLPGSLPSAAVGRLVQSADGALLAVVEEGGLYGLQPGGEWVPLDTGVRMEGSPPLLATPRGSLLTAAGNRGALRSEDGGRSWVPSSEGMTLFVRALAVDPDDPEVVYAGSLDSGVFKSTDGGESWVPHGLADRNLFDILISPADSNVLYAGSSLGVERSLDGGVTWSRLANRDHYIFDLAVDPADRNVLYAAGFAGRVHESRDAGVSWSLSGKGLPAENILAVTVDPVTGDRFAGVERQGVYRLAPGGGLWIRTSLEIQSTTKVIGLLAVSGGLYAATSGEGLWRSMDGGESWQQLPLPNDQVFGIRTGWKNPGDLLVYTLDSGNGDPSGLFHSGDGGESWVLLPFPETAVHALALSPVAPGLLFAAGSESLYRSEDGGVSWILLDSLPTGARVSSLWADPGSAERVLAGCEDGRILWSSDRGASWQETGISGKGVVTAFAPGADEGQIFAASLGNGVMRSDDGGASWSQGADHGLYDIPVLALAMDPDDTQRLYAATAGLGVFRSLDGGVNWEPASEGIEGVQLLSLHIDRNDSGVLFAGSAEKGLFISTDGARTWRNWNEGLVNHTVTSIVTTTLDPGLVYIGTEGGGVYRNRWMGAQ